MCRNPRCASVGTDLSNALAAWAYNATEASVEDGTQLLGLNLSHNCIPQAGQKPRNEGPRQDARGVVLFCRCPQKTVLPESKSTERRMVGDGIALMSALPEF